MSVDLDGIAPWRTPNETFYLIHTAIIPPAIEPTDWRLRIHGMVERELVLTYDDLMARQLTEAWVTLNCVSNPVGGDADRQRLVERRPARRPARARRASSDGADAVLQTSDDGWTCGTPLAALTDDRNAMLAVAMNGQPLPIEHGFPVRTLVPGPLRLRVGLQVGGRHGGHPLRGHLGVLDPAGLGRAGAGQDVVADRRTPAPATSWTPAPQRVGGVAWAQHTGISAVEVSLDGGAWQSVELGDADTIDTWVQWTTTAHARRGRPRRCGCAPPTTTARCRPAPRPTCCPTAPPGGTRSRFTAT